MLLAGDVGGTKTLLGLFETGPRRPRPIFVRAIATLEYEDLPSMIADFLDSGALQSAKGASIESACFGVAGPVIDDVAELTNVPWTVDARQVASHFQFPRVALLNDLQAMAYAVPELTASELHVLQAGHRQPGGNMALIAAGTGLGEALLHNVGGRFIPSPSEGGHADFAARTEPEIALLRDLVARYGRADVERVVSGPGLANIHRLTHRDRRCEARVDLADEDAPAAISSAAVTRRCDGCVEALALFVDAYGAEAGNLALRGVATGGVFIGGGIAPKILPALESGAFMRAFRAKPPLEAMLGATAVNVILNEEAGLLGAAVFASGT